MSDSDATGPVEIDPETLSGDALAALVGEFVTRDGTDYGAVERSLEEKSARVRAQLVSGEAKIVFDPESESVNIVLARELARRPDPPPD